MHYNKRRFIHPRPATQIYNAAKINPYVSTLHSFLIKERYAINSILVSLVVIVFTKKAF
jgi:hypothetical protein